MAMMIGTTASTPSPARLRRRPKMISQLGAQEPARQPAGSAAPGGRRTSSTSAADIEALPGERDEHVLQARRCTANPSTGTPSLTRSGTIFSTATSPSSPVTKPERGRARRLRPSSRSTRAASSGRSVSTRTVCTVAGPQLAHRSLGDQPALVHHADVAAHLLHLGQQVAGDQDVTPSSASSPIRCRTSRVPWGSSPLVGSSSTIRSRGISRALAMASRWRMPSEYAR